MPRRPPSHVSRKQHARRFYRHETGTAVGSKHVWRFYRHGYGTAVSHKHARRFYRHEHGTAVSNKHARRSYRHETGTTAGSKHAWRFYRHETGTTVGSKHVWRFYRLGHANVKKLSGAFIENDSQELTSSLMPPRLRQSDQTRSSFSAMLPHWRLPLFTFKRIAPAVTGLKEITLSSTVLLFNDQVIATFEAAVAQAEPS